MSREIKTVGPAVIPQVRTTAPRAESEARNLLVKTAVQDGFQVDPRLNQASGTGRAHEMLPHPRLRCFPPVVTRPPPAPLPVRVDNVFQALGSFLGSFVGSAAGSFVGSMIGAVMGNPSSPAAGSTPVACHTPNASQLAPGTEPLRYERMFAVLQLNGVSLARGEMRMLNEMSGTERARYVLARLSTSPGIPQPPGIEQELRSHLAPASEWCDQHQHVVCQREAFQELMSGLDSGGTNPVREQFLLRSLDEAHRNAYLSAKALRQLIGPPPSSRREVQAAKLEAQREHARFTRVINMMARGGPRNPVEKLRFAQDWQGLTHQQRLQAQTVKLIPGTAKLFSAQATRQLQTFTQMVSLLERVGPSSGLLRMVESANLGSLSPTQRAEYQRLKAHMAERAYPFLPMTAMQMTELTAAMAQNPEALNQVAALAPLATLLEQTAQSVSLIRAHAVTR